MTYSLSQKRLLIVGAAGRIGSATARAALNAGASVTLSDISEQRLMDLRDSLNKEFSVSVNAFVADTTDPASIDLLIANTANAYGSITSAVYSAYPQSEGWGTRFEDLTQKHLNEDLANQLGSAILFSQKILGHFERNGGGDLVHISSIQGISAPKFEHYHGTDMSSPVEYAAIKAGLISITRWLAKYYSGKSIRVNCVSPGGIRADQPNKFVDMYRKDCTNFGMLSSRQVAETIAFLLSENTEAINGQNIIVDDGWSL